MKRFDLKYYINNIKALSFFLVLSFDDPQEQLDTLNKLMIDSIVSIEMHHWSKSIYTFTCSLDEATRYS